MMRLSCNVGVIHELPLHTVTKAVSTTNVFKKLNFYRKSTITFPNSYG